MILQNVVHGTVTEKPLWAEHVKECMLFDNLNSHHDNAKTPAVYFTSNKDVCKFFSDEKMVDPDGLLQTIITADVLAQKPFEIEDTPLGSFEYKGNEYVWPEERALFYDALRADGYDCVIVKNDYLVNGVSAPDIAVLDDTIIKAKSVSIKHKGQWTHELNKAELESLLSIIANDDMIMEYEETYPETDFNPSY